MKSKQYYFSEIFYSLQGEGVRTGTANVFVRFAGCNLACDLEASEHSPGGWRCDTDFSGGMPTTAQDLVALCQELAPACHWIILTGGEPTLQLDQALINTLRGAGYKLAIETNGTTNIDAFALDWLCVSPKTAEHTLRQRTAHELKYVRHVQQALPHPRGTADHYLISPAFEADGSVRPETLRWCVQLCKDHPRWRLSLQSHKLLGVR